MTVRRATATEANTVFGFFEEMAAGATQDIFGTSDIWVVEDDGMVVTMASVDLADLPEDVVAVADHIGLRIGTMEGMDFHLDLQGAVLLATVSRSMTVRVSEQAARMWLYGKDILGDSVLSWPKKVGPGDACIVVNPRWEAIGIGEVLEKGKGQRPVIRPVHDLGTYLRDQGGD